MAKTERYETVIRLNTEQAKKEIDTLEKKIADLRKKQSSYAPDSKQFKNLEKEINKNVKQLEMMENRLTTVNKTISNMSDASPKQLRDTIKNINALLNSGYIERGSENWKALTAALKEANTELTKIKNESKASQPIMGKFFKFLNDSWGGILILVQSISGVTMTIRKSVEDYAKMEEEMADVRKYTGLTADQVRELNEELKKMDTRTPREQLNQLAGSAGRLGLQAKKDILEFVEAADMIGVALGDDLGDGAVDKIGKLAMAFGEDEKKGLKAAMLSTGSALNELAQNSSAQAGYLVEFTARVAGFGKQLGLTQAQIMGFGTVMDENLLKDEMAATAFGNMLTKMQTDTEKFARIAGMDVKAFTKLLNEDANAAILALAENLKKADPQNMMKMLDDMGLDGSRAVGVLSTLADKIDDVRRHQERATEAYEKAMSVQGEFNTMNTTVQAEIEKAKKRFHELSVELGEKLLPVVKYTITSGSLLVKALSVIAGVVTRNFGLISRLAVLIGGYTAAVQIATNATKIWSVATKATPWGLAAAGLALVITAIDKYKTNMAEARKKAEELNMTEANAVTQYSEEARKIKTLDKIMRDETVSIDQRRKALEKLKAIIPDYNGMLDEEGRLTRDNKKAIDDYLVSLEKQIRLKAYKDKLEELYKRQGEQEDAQREASDKYWNTRQSNTLQGQGNSLSGKLMDFLGIGEEAGLKRTLDKADRELADTNDKIETLKKKISDVGELADKEVKKSEGDGNDPGGTTPYISDADRKKQEAEAKKAAAEKLEQMREADKEAKAIMDNRLAENLLNYQAGLQDYRQFMANQEKIQREGLQARRDAWDEDTAEYAKYQKQLAALQLNGDQERTRQSAAAIDRDHKIMREWLKSRFDDQNSEYYQNEVALNEALYEQDIEFLREKAKLYRKGSLERMQIEWEIQDREDLHQLEQQRTFQQMVENLKTTYLQQGNAKREQMELNALEELNKKKLLTEEEYQRAKLAIQAQYSQAQTPDEKTADAGADMLKVAQTSAAKDAGTGTSTPIYGTISMYVATMDKLKELYVQDEKNHEAYLAAKQQATAQFCQQLASEFQAAYQTIGNLMSAASSYYGAQSDYEVAMTKKKYEKQIEAAGNNQKKVKKLQEQQAKEEAAIKTKYNNRQVKIQIAQALAQTATNALNAYGSAAAIPVVGYILAPIAAAMAVAAGMLQVATIKKQAEAQQAGYYEGGFTGGKRYRKEAGIVHEGEFVANHQAVNNPNILPFLNFLDQAQRNNTVGSLTAQDVSRSMGAAGTTQMITPIVNVQNDNPELLDTLERVNENQDRLATQLELGIGVDFPIAGEDGLYNRMRRYQNLLKSK